MKKTIVPGIAIFIMICLPLTAMAKRTPEEKLMRKSGCFKCHAVNKKKKGPSYKSLAEKYDIGDAAKIDELIIHITTGPEVEVEGKMEIHKKIKTDDPAVQRKVIEWVLSQ